MEDCRTSSGLLSRFRGLERLCDEKTWSDCDEKTWRTAASETVCCLAFAGWNGSAMRRRGATAMTRRGGLPHLKRLSRCYGVTALDCPRAIPSAYLPFLSCVLKALICPAPHECHRTRCHVALDVPSRLPASCLCCSCYTALSRWVKMLASAMHAFVGHTWEWAQLRVAKKHDTRSHSIHITAPQLNLGQRTSVQRRAP